jgi:hypothetical protein
MEPISNTGWLVVAFIATLTFIVFMLRGVKLGIGDKNLIIGKVDKKFDQFNKELQEKDAARLHDEELRKQLLKQSMAIDAHMTADLRKSVRTQENTAIELFAPYGHCVFPSISLVKIIQDELNERIDYNDIRTNLSGSNKTEYLKDIIKDIHHRYSTFLLRISKLTCGEQYPEWDAIKKNVESIISKWAAEAVKIEKLHIKQKIDMYEASKQDFKTEEQVKASILFPIEKNKKYLQGLEEC